MKAERTQRAITVHLSADEIFELQAGKNIGGRFGATLPDAKINVWPLSAIEPDDSLKDRWSDDRLEKGLRAPLRGRMDTDGDLSVFVPAIKLSDVRISFASLPREAIIMPGTRDEDKKEFLKKAIPEKGVIVVFGGSLQVVNVNATYYQEEE